MVQETAKLLADFETELTEIGETTEEALNKTFQEEYEVVNVSVEKGGLIVVSVKLMPDKD